MAKKEVAAPLQRTQPQAKNHTSSIPAEPKSVKAKSFDLQAFRAEKGILAKDVVEVVKELYPKYDKMIHSKCEHGTEYGIQLRPDAMRVLIERYDPDRLNKPRKENRKKTNRIQARLPDSLYEQLQLYLRDTGTKAQDFIEGLVAQFFKTQKE